MNKFINILKLSAIEFVFNFFGSRGALKKFKNSNCINKSEYFIKSML